MNQEIGGYFSLELSNQGVFLHSDGYCLNSGRNALEYILLSIPKIIKLWIPYYTCDVILEPIRKLNIPYSFYSINERLEIKDNLQLFSEEYLLVNNYFGIKDDYIKSLSEKYGRQLIVDNAQAYFCKPLKGIKTIYSPRKFVGIPDGGIAFTDKGENIDQYDKDLSYERCGHLLKRYDLGANAGYKDFKENSLKLENQPIRRMSELTRNLLSSIDFKLICEKRKENFNFLHNSLASSNKLNVSSFGNFASPMVYPYYTDNPSLKSILINENIYVATYWPNVKDWCIPTDLEYDFVKNIIALPIDQRYGTKEMNQLLAILNKNK